MKNLTRVSLALLALAPFVQARLEENLPATTYGLIKIESVAKARKNLDANPLALALKGPKFSDFLKPFADKISKDADTAGKLAEFEKHRDAILGAFNGEIVLAMTKTPSPAPHHDPFDFVLLADTTLDEKGMAELLKKLDLHQPRAAGEAKPAASSKGSPAPQAEDDEDDAEPVSSSGGSARPVAPELIGADEDHRGVTLHTLQVKIDDKPVTLAGWAIVEKTFIYTTAPNVLRELVDARREGLKDSFADQPVFKANRDALEDSDAWVLLNMPLIAGSLREIVAKSAVDAEGNAKPGLMGMDKLKSYDSLGLDAFRHVRVAFSFKPDDMRADSSVAWSEKRGLVKFFSDCVPADATADLSVLPSGVLAASAARYDLSKFLATIETMLRDAFPLAAPMFDVQLDKVKNQEGLDIRGAILGNLGDEVWSFSDPLPASAFEEGSAKPPQAASVFVLSVKDENRLASFIETLAGKAAPQTGDGVKSLFEERELLGVKVRAVRNLPPTSPRIQYALTKGRLFVSMGEGKLLDRAIAQFASPKGGLAADPAFKEGLSRLPKNPSSVLYYDLGEYASLLGRVFAMSVNKSGKGAESFVDPAKAPSAADLPFVAVGTSVVGENEMRSRTVVVRKPDAAR